jgi:protein-S-isoprenylcysteine O-methyltransferase Ste14
MMVSATKLRLGAAWVAAPLFLLLARPSAAHLVCGLPLAAAGLALRAWASGTIRKNVVLATGGPYAYTRNPLYLGSFLIALGLAIAGGRLVFVAAVALFFASIYGWVMRREAQRLEREFGEEYRRWAASVPAFLPRLLPRRVPAGDDAGFRLATYLKHHEYEAALGVAVGFLVLVLKLALA